MHIPLWLWFRSLRDYTNSGLGQCAWRHLCETKRCEYAVRIMPVPYLHRRLAFPLHSISGRGAGVIRRSCLYACTSVHLYAWTSLTTVRQSIPRRPEPPGTLSYTSAPRPAAGGEGVVLPESGSATARPLGCSSLFHEGGVSLLLLPPGPTVKRH